MTEKLALKSMDITEEKKKALKQLFPEVFTEGKIDFERLKQVLGEAVDSSRERYGLTWAGKSEAIKNIQTQSIGTLRPVPEESVNFDTTENLIIEGDNLEVLKLLQKSYYGKVKMIYIDPPYNTGNEFIYTDNYKEGLKDYLRFTGQVDENGVKISTNTETSGRYHSKWLNMMYPRLFLARNLLKEDGVIFVSIDDHEVQNLRAIMDEIFGEENFVANFVWQKKYGPANDSNSVSTTHEYILLYAKNKNEWKPGLLPRNERQLSAFSNPDNDPRGPWRASDLSARTYNKNCVYPIVGPTGKTFYPPASRSWIVNQKRFQELLEDNRITFGRDGNGRPMLKTFLSEVKQGITPETWLSRDKANDNKGARYELKELIPENVYDTPKPTKLINHLSIISNIGKNDIILDFFAGSGTTAHSVLNMNKEDGGNRKFILVQLPEPTDHREYPTISEITKERVRRVINKIKQEDELGINQQDLGFKVFKLDSSNFKIWEGEFDDPSKLEDQLEMFTDNIKDGRSEADLLYEIVLKAGYMLTEKIEAVTVGETKVYSVKGGEMLVCLSRKLDSETIEGIMDLEPKQVICLDLAFMGNDQLKTNTVLQMKSKGIKFRTV